MFWWRSVYVQREISCCLTLDAHFSHLSLLLPAQNLLVFFCYLDFFLPPKSDIPGIYYEQNIITVLFGEKHEHKEAPKIQILWQDSQCHLLLVISLVIPRFLMHKKTCCEHLFLYSRV